MLIGIVGDKGSGKTLTAVRLMHDCFSYVITDIKLKNMPNVHQLRWSDIIKPVQIEKDGKFKTSYDINWDFWGNIRKKHKNYCICIDETHNIISSRRCLAKGTMIKTSLGDMPIEKIKNEVLSYDFLNNKVVVNRCKVSKEIHKNINKIMTKNDVIYTSHDHLFPTHIIRNIPFYMPACMLSGGDYLFKFDFDNKILKKELIIDVEKISKKITMYDIEILEDDNHNFILGNGVISHNSMSTTNILFSKMISQIRKILADDDSPEGNAMIVITQALRKIDIDTRQLCDIVLYCKTKIVNKKHFVIVKPMYFHPELDDFLPMRNKIIYRGEPYYKYYDRLALNTLTESQLQ